MHKLLLSLFSLMCLIPSLASAQDVARDESLFYAFTAPNGDTSLCWLFVNDVNKDICVIVPEFTYYSVSPSNLLIAFVQSSNSQVHLLNTITQEIVSLNLCQPQQDFLWDDYYQKSGSLVWSPDGNMLAFTGSNLGDMCEESTANLYIYNVETLNLTNITIELPTSTPNIMPASWSSNGEWLSLYGAWSHESGMGADWGSVVISVNTLDFRRIAPLYSTCRLIWSPNMSWLASNTDCFEGIGNGSDLIFIPFNPQPLGVDDLYLDNIVAPLTFGRRPITGWTSSYTLPIWLDDNRVVAHRKVTPITLGYIPPETYASNGVTMIDVMSISEEQIFATPNATVISIGHWFVMRQDNHYGAYYTLTEKYFTIPMKVIPCMAKGSLAFIDDGKYLAVIDNCSQEQSVFNLTIYASNNFDNFLVQRTLEAQKIKLL